MYHDNRTPLEPEFTQLKKPEEGGFYETGSTRPPKNHGGLITMILLAMIFGIGIIGICVSNIEAEPKIPENIDEEKIGSLGDFLEAQTRPTEPVEPKVKEKWEQMMISNTPESVPNVTKEGALSLQEIYEKVNPSVVSVTAEISGSKSSGSGVVMSKKGYIITCAHVVDNATSIRVTLADQRSFDAVLVGKDTLTDLAVLSIDASDLVAAEFGDSESCRVGDPVSAIGDPLGLELRGTMTDGIISAINRNLVINDIELNLIQTTAALNKGNSGGPLINCYGQVIGINTAKIGDAYSSGGVEGLGFALPVNIVKEVVDQLVETGYVPGRPSLGVELTELEYQYQMFYRLPSGLYVTHVSRDSNAWAAGLREGDVITSVSGRKVYKQKDLTAALQNHVPGDVVDIQVYRSSRGQLMAGTLVLEEAGQESNS